MRWLDRAARHVQRFAIASSGTEDGTVVETLERRQRGRFVERTSLHSNLPHRRDTSPPPSALRGESNQPATRTVLVEMQADAALYRAKAAGRDRIESDRPRAWGT